MGEPGGEHSGLAGTGAGQHQHRAVERLDRLALLGIEPFEIRRTEAGAAIRSSAAVKARKVMGILQIGRNRRRRTAKTLAAPKLPRFDAAEKASTA